MLILLENGYKLDGGCDFYRTPLILIIKMDL
jgi:hypothetical protein